MVKKVIIAIVCILIVIVGISYFLLEKNNETVPDTQNENTNNIDNSSKTAIIYFSATGNTKKISEYIKNKTNGDIIEIIPKEKYTSEDLSYNNDCRANREQQDNNARPEIENNIDVTKYETIFLGYPIWWETGIYVRQAEKVA